MSKDVKIEIIYYKSDTDVSLEFGLHGDYPVRLLSTASNDLRSFFLSLKRAVSRSEIIIVVGGYSGDEYIPSFIARAIKKECAVPEYGRSGVICKEKYPLPEGSVPLAPSGKHFGGFLIESGPQTIISLTENKKIRLGIVTEIIVKYIEEHHNFFANGYNTVDTVSKTDADTLSVLPIIPDKKGSDENFSIPESFEDISSISSQPENIYVSETDNNSLSEDINEEIPEIGTDVQATDVDRETAEENTVDVSSFESEPTSEAVTAEEENEPIDIISHKYTDPESNILTGITPDDFDFEKRILSEPDANDDEEFETGRKPTKTRPRRRVLRILCIVLTLLIIIGTAVTVFIVNKTETEEASTKDYYALITETYNSYGEDHIGAFNALRSYNENITAWLSIDGTELYHPVLSVDKGDSFYLDHLPDGSENILGSVYSESDIDVDVFGHNTVIFGSAESGLGVFSTIADLFESNDISSIGKISFTNRFGRSEWRVTSMFTDSEANDLVYDVSSFDSDTKYQAFLNQLLRHNRTNTLATLNDPSSPVLMLIAIDSAKRYIICASPYDTVSYSDKLPDDVPGTGDTIPDILIDINDAIIDFIGKTEDNADEYEQQPIDPDNVIQLPPITVTPPSNDTSSDNTVTSDESTVTSSDGAVSSKPEDISSESSSIGSSSEEASSSDTSSSEPSSSDISSSDTSTPSSSDTSSVTSSDSSSSDTSSSTSSETSSSSGSSSASSNTSSDTTSGGTEKPSVDPLYTWDITLYVKQSNGTIVYGTASEIVARVIEAEMGSGFPLEALKSQAVAAYCWLLNNGAYNQSTAPSGVPMKQTPGARALQAVSEVKGALVTYNGTIAQTYYYAYSAGYTANVQDVWTAYIPYLQSVECPVDAELERFITTKTYSADEIKTLILNKCGIDVSEMDKTEWIKPVEYDSNNTYCTYVEIGGVRYKGKFLRSTLLSNGIRSTAYTVEYDAENDSFIFTCKGWGHGVGMSQEGAKAYANLGWTYEQILAHFYPGTTLIKY